MAWMPIAEAAVTLGVSERTVWRRIKNDAIPSRSESGRTLVEVEQPSQENEAVRQLSHVAAAQLSMRKLDADNVSDVLAIVTDYRQTFDREIAGARKSKRWSVAIAILLLIGLTGSIAFHLYEKGRLQDRHLQVLAEARATERQRVESLTDAVARAEEQADARRKALSQLESVSTRQNAHLTSLARSRDDLQCVIDERLAAVQSLVDQSSHDEGTREKQLLALRDEITGLRSELQRRTDLYVQVQNRQGQVNDAIRRAAARSNGIAEGLRLHVAYQHDTVRDLRRELADARAKLATSETSADNVDPRTLRRDLLASLVNESESNQQPRWLQSLLDEPQTGPWRVLLTGLSRVWLIPGITGDDQAINPTGAPVAKIPVLADEFASAQ